jgi:hypothetical protein
MGNMGKSLALMLMLMMAISSLTMLMVKPVNAESIPKPSVPQFTIKYVDDSYDVPSKTNSTINPYTGKTETTIIPGYHVSNFTVHVIIKNQPFNTVTVDGNQVNLFFAVRYKGHFGTDWIEQYPDTQHMDTYGYDYLPVLQSSSGETLIICPGNYPNDAQVDFQVMALQGYFSKYYTHVPLLVYTWVFTGQKSDWSNTQTITIPSASAAPSPTPTIPEYPFLLTVIFAMAIILLGSVLVRIRQFNGNRKQVFSMLALTSKTLLLNPSIFS